ncbi:hypothetical protein ABZ871_27245 [Streptomyces populi]
MREIHAGRTESARIDVRVLLPGWDEAFADESQKWFDPSGQPSPRT